MIDLRTTMIYLPVRGDTLIERVANNAIQWMRDAHGHTPPIEGPRATHAHAPLRGLNYARAGALMVIGHGNLGAGIGTHSKYYDAHKLVRRLRKDGLAPGQTDLVIYLYACNTAVSCNHRWHWAHRAPYGERFANALGEVGFTNTAVVGYAGFMTESRRSVMRYYMLGDWAGTKKNPEREYMNPTRRHDREVVWDVMVHGPAQQTEGDAWITRTSWRRMKIEQAP